MVMGSGWGGARLGAGRKPRGREGLALAGSRQAKRRKKASDAPVVPLAPVAVPDDLPVAERAAWEALAPQAQAGGTLTAATADAFRLLCRNVALEQALRASEKVGGADHRGMIRIVEIGMARFCLAPMGKALASPEKPDDPFAEFDGGQVQ